VVAAGGLAPEHSRWISSRCSFFLPVKVLSRVFRGKFIAGLKTAFHAGALQFHRTSLAACGTARLRLVAAGTVPSRLVDPSDRWAGGDDFYSKSVAG